MLVTIYALFTYGMASIHSDSAISLRFYNSIRENNQLYPDTWLSANGEVYSFNTLVISLATFFLFGTTPLARIIASVISLLLACWSLYFFSKRYIKDDSWVISVPVIMLFLCSNNARDMLLYQTAYVFQIIALTVVFQLSYRILINNITSKGLIILHTIILYLMAMEGVRFIAEYVVPFACFLFIYIIINRRTLALKDIKRLIVKSFILGIVPLCLGFGAYKLICLTHNMNNTGASSLLFVQSINEFLNNIKATCVSFANVFGYSTDNHFALNIIACVLALLLCLIFPVLQLVELKKENDYEKNYVFFSVIHNVVMLGVVILAGKLNERYILSSVFIFVIISSHYVWKRISANKKNMIAFLFLFTILTCGFSLSLIMSTNGWKDIYDSEKLVCEELQEREITKGYASYWNAYTYEIYSNNEIRFGAIHVSPRQLQKYYWLVDENAFESNIGRSCIMLTQDENDNYSYAVNLLLGPSVETFTIEDVYAFDFYNDCYTKTNMVVYVYDEDVCDKLTNGLWDDICDVWEMDFNWIGTMTENSIILSQGGIVHGPYSYISEGKYSVKFEGEELVGCDVSAVSENTPEYVQQSVISIEEDCIEMIVDIDVGVDDIQFYLYNSMPDTEVVFYDVKIERIE